MKKIILIVLFFTTYMFANSVTNDFDNGNQLYQAGKYQEAIKRYEQLLKSGVHSSELYFNIGNCYFKLHKTAPAIFNFEKALLLNPNDCEILNNLDFVKKTTIDEVVEAPKVGFSALIQSFTSSHHYNTWAWIAVVFSILFLISFIIYFFSISTLVKRIFFTSMIVFLLADLVSIFSGFYEKSISENQHFAIVFENSISVKSEPKSSATEVFVLHEGTKVSVLETMNSYKKIQLLDLKQGWIKSSALKEYN
jgi:tetratricopeptide (TPR) repeat protein